MSPLDVSHSASESIARDTLSAPDGHAITVWRWPRKTGRATLHWAHGTGLNARAYTPLLERLSTCMNVTAWDMRGHGASAAAGHLDTFRGWETYYQDLSALLDAADEPLWLAGHSIGAMCSMAVAARQPDKVLGLLLIDPVIMTRWQALSLPVSRRLKVAPRSRLVAGAARRRERFASRAVALDNFFGRGAFKTWPDHWLAAYVAHGLVDAEDGGVRLAASPAWESATFDAEHNPWPNVRRLGRGHCAVSVLAASSASTFAKRARPRFARLVPRARIESVAGTSHFLPMERPDVVIDAVTAMLGGPCLAPDRVV